MKIGLIDVDSHNFPNLALMKLSAYHKKLGDNIEWYAPLFSKCDTVYISKVFSFSPDIDYTIKADKIIKGGSGYDFNNKLTDVIENICPDYNLYNCEHAYGFLTRGCIRKCSWCIVPEKEGNIQKNSDISDFIADKKSAIIMDNNILASDYGIKQIEKIIKMKIKVDFNQGLDARLIDDSIAKLLSKVKWLSPLRLACDSESMKEPIRKAVELLRWHNCFPQLYFIYMLVDNLEDAIDRVKFLKGMYIDPFAQPFIDYNKKTKTPRIINEFCRWVNMKGAFRKYNFKEWLKIRNCNDELL